MIIDAKNMIVGRIATVAAKKALMGGKIDIINCESAAVTGKKKFLYQEYSRKKNQGTFKGPFLPRMPDRFVKRIVRGMLPYKQEKGRKALKNIMCHIGIPKSLESRDTLKIENADISKTKNLNYLTVGEICRKLGRVK
ncbi:50S ribosomal protein L13 [Candidatus Woesearchaeota archaeon]|nr:50S ribosomal protein L13 [Candidatus Woesearchaeota archaeon]